MLQTGQLLRYDGMLDNDREPLHHLSLSAAVLRERSSVEFRYDLLDCQVRVVRGHQHADVIPDWQVYVCSPEVLLHFSDNYDYQTITRVRGCSLGGSCRSWVLDVRGAGLRAQRGTERGSRVSFLRACDYNWFERWARDALGSAPSHASVFRRQTMRRECVDPARTPRYRQTSCTGARTRARSWMRMWTCVTRQGFGRWTYPLVPDANFLGDSTYSAFRGGVYKYGCADAATTLWCEFCVRAGRLAYPSRGPLPSVRTSYWARGQLWVRGRSCK